jgi:hypothetical protein
MIESARLPLDYPEAAVVEEETLEAQIRHGAATCRRARSCSAAAAARTSARSKGSRRRRGRLGVVWFDAHGDLNTPETSRPATLGHAAADDHRRRRRRGRDVAVVGARNLDPPEVEFIAAPGSTTTAGRVLDRVDGSTSRSTATSFEPGELRSFMPEPGGPDTVEVERASGGSRSATRVRAGLTGLATDAGAREARAARTARL